MTAVAAPQPITAGPWAPRLIGVARFAALVYVFALVFLALSAVIPAVASSWQPLSVVSGSMQPAIAPGSLVMVQPADPDSFYAHPSILAFNDPDRPGQLLTHRVVDTARVAGVVRYTTKGDANRVDDSGIVAHGDVVGAVRMVIPFVGLPATWVHNGNLATFCALAAGQRARGQRLLVRARP